MLCWSLIAPLTGTSTPDQKFALSGYVRDSSNGEAIAGSSISTADGKYSSTSNQYGFYSLSLPEGTHQIVCSFLGYKSQSVTVSIKGNVTRNFELVRQEEVLKGYRVTAKKKDNMVNTVDMSTNNLSISQIKKVPALLGEVDIVKSVQLLPGVSTVGEGASGFNVRGGSIDQNLILLDEAPVFNSSHLFGFFSVFNPDAVRDVKLIKGGVPSRYGGRLASALDVRMKEGNNKKYEVNGGVGVIFSRFSVEGPIAPNKTGLKNRSSFIIAGRRSYIDVLAKPFLRNNESLRDAVFYFYDLTAKVNYTFDSKNRLYLSAYAGRDVFGAPGAKFDWGNTTTTLRWNHLFSRKLFANMTAYYSNYDYRLGFGVDDNTFEWRSNIINFSFKPDLTFFLNPQNTVQFGLLATYYNFKPGTAKSKDQGVEREFGLPDKYAAETAVYVENEQKVNSKLTLRYGIRVSQFSYLGKGRVYELERNGAADRAFVTGTKDYGRGEVISTYWVPEPRFAANYKLSKDASVKASYNRMSQYLHLVSNTAASVPLDVWTPSTNNIRPQIGDQIAAGYFRNFGKNLDFEASVEGFYKELQNQIDYVDGANLLLNPLLETELLSGKGRAYGVELYLKKNTGKLTGWIAYTLSKSERKVEGISQGQWYNNRFDRRHNMNISASYEINPKWTVSSAFVFASGTPTNLPNTKYSFRGIQGIPHNASDLRNNVTIKPFNRLDISATWQRKKTVKRESSWVFGVYNVYARRNPFSYYTRNNPDNNNQTQLIRYAVVGAIVPSVSWNFKFL